jgi:hypothetical protein
VITGHAPANCIPPPNPPQVPSWQA